MAIKAASRQLKAYLRKLASQGGKARAQKLSATERSRIARKAVKTYWRRKRAQQKAAG